jgi:two-component system response regulator FixJ
MLTNQMTVFIVDDQTDVRASLRMLLTIEGFTVYEFDSAAAFFANYQADWQGCVLLDLGLLDQDGLKVQKQLQQRASALRCILMSGHGDQRAAQQALANGAAAFLTKPIAAQDLLNVLTHLFNTQDQAS